MKILLALLLLFQAQAASAALVCEDFRFRDGRHMIASVYSVTIRRQAQQFQISVRFPYVNVVTASDREQEAVSDSDQQFVVGAYSFRRVPGGTFNERTRRGEVYFVVTENAGRRRGPEALVATCSERR